MYFSIQKGKKIYLRTQKKAKNHGLAVHPSEALAGLWMASNFSPARAPEKAKKAKKAINPVFFNTKRQKNLSEDAKKGKKSWPGCPSQ